MQQSVKTKPMDRERIAWMLSVMRYKTSALALGSVFVLSLTSLSGLGMLKVAAATAPSTPANVTLSASAKSVAVLWDASTAGTNAIAKYNVYRNSTLIGNAVPNSAAPVKAYSTGTRYIDTSVTTGNTYSYQVEAVDTTGLKSAKTAVVSVAVPTAANSVAEPTITLDSSADPTMATWLSSVVKPELLIWYPKIGNRMAYPDYVPPTSFTLKIDTAYTGMAEVRSGNVIILGDAYFKNNKSDVGCVIHEIAHVVQVYPVQPLRPFWVTEGIADWVRAYYYREPNFANTTVNKKTAYYDQGYRVSAYFLEWVRKHYMSGLIRSFNVRSHAGLSTADFEANYLTGGKNFDEMWSQMTGTSAARGTITAAANSAKCADDYTGSWTSGNKIDIWDCNGSMPQHWGIVTGTDGVSALHIVGGCMDVKSSGTADGTLVQLWGCNGTGAQQWVLNSANKTIVNVNSNKCLTAPSLANGTQLTISTCTGARSQQWMFPN